MRPERNLVVVVLLLTATAHGSVKDLLQTYQQSGAGPFDPAAGAAAWVREQRPDNATAPRSCASCHGVELHQSGRHATTGKVIEPMAPSVNSQRVTNPTKVEKWFRRNCRWTFERECTPQEKGDFLRYISEQ